MNTNEKLYKCPECGLQFEDEIRQKTISQKGTLVRSKTAFGALGLSLEYLVVDSCRVLKKIMPPKPMIKSAQIPTIHQPVLSRFSIFYSDFISLTLSN